MKETEYFLLDIYEFHEEQQYQAYNDEASSRHLMIVFIIAAINQQKRLTSGRC